MKSRCTSLSAKAQAACINFIQKMYRPGPDVSTGFCGLHHVRPLKEMHWQTDMKVEEASIADLARIEGLMQFYNYDLSEWLPVSFGPNGMYAIASKLHYWERAAVKPYVISVSDELAGFAVIDDDFVRAGANFNLGYFFIARRFRGRGLSHKFLGEIFRHHAGAWQLYHYSCNVPASRFWPKALSSLLGTSPVAQQISVDEHPAVLYEFSTSAA